MEENRVLQEVLNHNYGVNATFVWHSNGVRRYPHLYLPRPEAMKLIPLCDAQFVQLKSIKNKFFAK
jgi:hypothetical protein